MGAPQKKWTQAEQNLFLEAYYTRRRERHMTKGLARVDAQKASVAKERHYAKLQTTHKLMPAFIIEQIELMEAKHMAEGDPKWLLPAEVEEVAEVAEMAPPASSQAIPLSLNFGGVHFLRIPETIAAEFIAALKAQVTQGLREYILTEMDLNFNKILDYLTDPEKRGDDGQITIQEVRNRKKIVIVGLLPAQFNVVQAKFPKLLMKNIESSQTGSKLAPAAATAELVIIMTDWVNHSAQEIAKKHAAGRYLLCTGTVTSLVHRLTELQNQGL